MPTFALALLTVAAAQLLDLATFAEMIRRVGPAAEANPLVALLFDSYGMPMVVAAKLALIALVTSIAVITARWPATRVSVVVVAVAIVAGLVGGLSNTVAIGVL